MILIVDDDPDICRFVRLALESEGYRVTTARNGLDALDCVRECRPTAVLLDINMPVMDGLTFARHARQEFGELPLIVMTAGTEAERCRREAGAADSLPKPFNLDELLDKVGKFAPA
jgi:DNA-binding response OmpR family regulator